MILEGPQISHVILRNNIVPNFFKGGKYIIINIIFIKLDLSMCWGEFNFVRAEYYPVVFTHIVEENTSKPKLLYSLNLEVDFDPKNIRIDQDGKYMTIFQFKFLNILYIYICFVILGLLYHLVDINDLDIGIFSSDLAVSLSDKLTVNIYMYKIKKYIFKFKRGDL